MEVATYKWVAGEETCICILVEVVTCKLGVEETYICIPAVVEVTCKCILVVEETCICILAMAAVVKEETCKCISARVAAANCKHILGEEAYARTAMGRTKSGDGAMDGKASV